VIMAGKGAFPSSGRLTGTVKWMLFSGVPPVMVINHSLGHKLLSESKNPMASRVCVDLQYGCGEVVFRLGWERTGRQAGHGVTH
jgi:hypothetical protein